MVWPTGGYHGYYETQQQQPWQPWSGVLTSEQSWCYPIRVETGDPGGAGGDQSKSGSSPLGPAQEVPSLPSPAADSESGYSSYGGSYTSYTETGGYTGHGSTHVSTVSPGHYSSVSPPSSPDSADSVFVSDSRTETPQQQQQQQQQQQITLPPINLKNNTSFTEAELKAITPWRNALIERLLANQARSQAGAGPLLPIASTSDSSSSSSSSSSSPPNQNLFNMSEVKPQRLQMYNVTETVKPVAGGRQRQGRGQGRGGQSSGGPPFHNITGISEFVFGDGPGFDGRVSVGSTGFLAISGCIKQANQVILASYWSKQYNAKL